jgi:hypothetical protein
VFWPTGINLFRAQPRTRGLILLRSLKPPLPLPDPSVAAPARAPPCRSAALPERRRRGRPRAAPPEAAVEACPTPARLAAVEAAPAPPEAAVEAAPGPRCAAAPAQRPRA